MAVDTTPHNSWIVYSTGERNQLMRPQYRLRSKYILTKDPLPVMNYKQLEKALPENYDLPLGEELTASTESLPELLEEETLSVEESTPLGEEPMEGTEELMEYHEEEILSAEEFTPSQEGSEGYVSLAPATGSIGDEISVDADWGLAEITEVRVNGILTDFLSLNDTNLVFVIPLGATSGTVELVSSSGDVINAGVLEVV